MPEGHVIHRLARRLNKMAGPVEVSSPQGRFAASAEILNGHEMVRAEAIGKHLFVFFDEAIGPEHIVYIHLGLIGHLRFEPASDLHGQIRLRIVSGDVAAHLRGPQYCKLVDDSFYASTRARAGEDPLRKDADPAVVSQKVLKSGRAIGTLLLDQGMYAGVGSIYRTETLFRLGIDPHTPGKELSSAQVEAIWDDLVETMQVGLETGQIDTVRPEHMPEAMNRPPRDDEHGGEVYVYRRAGEPCHVCGTEITMEVMQSRKIFYCSRCQEVA